MARTSSRSSRRERWRIGLDSPVDLRPTGEIAHIGVVNNAFAVSCGAVLALSLVVSMRPAISDSGETPTDRPVEAHIDGYVTSGTCRACHPREYATWHSSFHRTMTQVAASESVLGDFNNARVESNGVRYRLFKEGDAFFAEWEQSARIGKQQRHRVLRRLLMTTGSHHDQMYWYSATRKDRALQQLPLDYSLRLGRWIPAQSTYLTPASKRASHAVGEWNRVCSKCHSVSPELRADDDGLLDTRVAEFGIACEACHGPAEEHVLRNRDPLHRYAQHLGGNNDSSIVQPARLDSRRAAQVCGQCHGVWLMGDELDGYRPGMNINERRIFVRPRYLEPDYQPGDARERRSRDVVRAAVAEDPGFFSSTFWSDGIIRVSGREYSGLLESPCFERGEISCNSCHSMHLSAADPRSVDQWRSDQLGDGMQGNAACTGCHPHLAGEALTAHTHHPTESAGSLCYNCHMPFTAYGIQKAHRSHTVTNPSADETLATGRPNACNGCHLDHTLAETAESLEQWYGMSPPRIAGDDAHVATGALWALRGDAGQRALAAWSMGWDAAREASGAREKSDWMIPYLAQLLDDPYDAVRFVAFLALRKRVAYADFDYDFVGPPSQRRAAVDRARAARRFVYATAVMTDASALLLDSSGAIVKQRFDELLRQRDNRRVDLRE